MADLRFNSNCTLADGLDGPFTVKSIIDVRCFDIGSFRGIAVYSQLIRNGISLQSFSFNFSHIYRIRLQRLNRKFSTTKKM